MLRCPIEKYSPFKGFFASLGRGSPVGNRYCTRERSEACGSPCRRSECSHRIAQDSLEATLDAQESWARSEMQRIREQLAGLPHDTIVKRGKDA